MACVAFGLRGGDTRLQPRPPEPVSETPQLSINVNTSPVAAADPRRPEVMAVAGRVDAPRLNCTVAVTTTGGEAWRDVGLPLAPGAENCFWPAVAFDGDGNLLVLYTPTGRPVQPAHRPVVAALHPGAGRRRPAGPGGRSR